MTSVTTSASPRLRADEKDSAPAEGQPSRDQRRAAWVAVAVLAALLGYLLFMPRTERESVPPKTESVAKVPAGTRGASRSRRTDPTVIAAEVESTLVSSQPLKTTDLSVATVAGKLEIWPAVDDVRKRVLRVNDAVIPDLRDDAIVLAHRTVFLRSRGHHGVHAVCRQRPALRSAAAILARAA